MVDPATPTETGFGTQSAALQLTVDTVPPPVAFGTPRTWPDRDWPRQRQRRAGFPYTNTDNITNDTPPTFYGVAEANAIVRVYALVDTATDAIASATETGTTVTITTTTANGFSVGNLVVIAGAGVAGYDGTFTITAILESDHLHLHGFRHGAGGVWGGGTATSVPATPPRRRATSCWARPWPSPTTAPMSIPTAVDGDVDRGPQQSRSTSPTTACGNLCVTAEDLAGNVPMPGRKPCQSEPVAEHLHRHPGTADHQRPSQHRRRRPTTCSALKANPPRHGIAHAPRKRATRGDDHDHGRQRLRCPGDTVTIAGGRRGGLQRRVYGGHASSTATTFTYTDPDHRAGAFQRRNGHTWSRSASSPTSAGQRPGHQASRTCRPQVTGFLSDAIFLPRRPGALGHLQTWTCRARGTSAWWAMPTGSSPSSRSPSPTTRWSTDSRPRPRHAALLHAPCPTTATR